ncbi:MAG TPA: MarR family transcriptional regulator [Caulobacteraceae bacterium]|jgi:DNA-binding MarR family transcriptional regulator|nr:MarR family transcriptional regulator [Caulobacteraceae bacterium]
MAAEEDPGREAWMLLIQLFRSQRREMAAMQTELGLNLAQAHLLKAIEAPQGNPMSEIAEALFCDASYVTGLVDKLEERGLVQRLPSPDDRRVKLVALTEAGRTARANFMCRLSQPPPFIESMSVEDKRALCDIFAKAAQALQDNG